MPLPDAPPPAEPLAGRYRLERELGRGGMATVYLATDLRHQRRVAVKVLRGELAASLSAERFLREIRITGNLVHPHILALHDAGEADGRLFFAMPYVEGETLRARVDREGPLPVAEAVRLAREVADALAYAHARGVVHRDVKPENVLLSGGHAVVADFGISRAAGETLTTAGVAVGTPAYMSPEQAAGAGPVDARSDVYSLACVLYTTLTGHAPFRGGSAQAVAMQHLTAVPPAADAERPEVPAALARVVARAMAKDPGARFDGARAFADALAPWSVAAPGDRPAPRRRGRPWLTAAGALAAAALVGAAGLYARRPAPEPGLVAVAPFVVASGDSALRRWQYDLPLLVAPRLDHAGPLRALSPVTGVGDRPPVADRAAAAALGRRTHAAYVVFGRVVPLARGGVRVEAEVLDVARGAVVDRVQALAAGPDAGPDAAPDAGRDAGRALAGVSDALGRALLESFGASVPVAATRHAAFGCASSSWPAVAHYLRGEQFYRRTQWDSAVAAYQAAATLDSGCALAYRRIATVLAWRGTVQDSAVRHYRLLAGAHNRALPPRDSLLVTADSLAAAVDVLAGRADVPGAARWAHVRRLFATLDEAARRYPGDAEVWYALGEARYHSGWGPAATTPGAILAAFDEAIRLDSGFALSYLHPIEVALGEGGPARARPYVAGFLRSAAADTGQADVNAAGVRLAAALLAPDAARSPAVARRLAHDSASTLAAARNLLDRWPDPDAWAVRLAAAREARAGADTAAAARCRPGRPAAPLLARRLAYRGRLRDALCALGDSAGRGTAGGVLVELALLGGAPAGAVTPVYDAWLRGDAPAAARYRNRALPWWAARRDTLRIAEFGRRADSVLRAGPDPAARDRAAYDAAAARAYAALARGDTLGALRRLRALPHDRCHTCFRFDRLTEARLLVARDSLRAAAGILGEWRGATAEPADVLVAALRARVRERLGDAAAARADYDRVVRTWAGADAALRPVVDDARRALARLSNAPPAPPP